MGVTLEGFCMPSRINILLFQDYCLKAILICVKKNTYTRIIVAAFFIMKKKMETTKHSSVVK